MDQRLEALGAVVDAIAANGQKDILYYAGAIDDIGFASVVEQTQERTSTEVLLLLTTNGGDANSAYRIASLLARRYKVFRLLVSSQCKSAGTLIAVGAHEIIMTDTGELGPLDVQIRKRDEIIQRESGLEMFQGLEDLTEQAIAAFRQAFLHIAAGSGLSSRLCADIAANIVGQLYGNIFAQIDPIRLGSVSRANQVAMHYGQKLGTRNLKPDALETLVLGYPEHGFVIDRIQAEELFQHVRDATIAEAALGPLAKNLLVPQGRTEHAIARLDDLVRRYREGKNQHASPPGGSVSAQASPGVEATDDAGDGAPRQRVARGSTSAADTSTTSAKARGHSPADGDAERPVVVSERTS